MVDLLLIIILVSGIFDLNMGPIDKDMMLVDLEGARLALDMNNAASEILGYERGLFFNNQRNSINAQSIII